MKIKIMVSVILVLILSLVFATVASAKSSKKTKIVTITKDGQDGTIDGHYTAAEIQAALDYIANDPLYQQYSDLQGVLQAYLASLQAPGVKNSKTPGVKNRDKSAAWELAFTGSRILFVFGAGIALIGSGFALRRRHA